MHISEVTDFLNAEEQKILRRYGLVSVSHMTSDNGHILENTAEHAEK